MKDLMVRFRLRKGNPGDQKIADWLDSLQANGINISETIRVILAACIAGRSFIVPNTQILYHPQQRTRTPDEQYAVALGRSMEGLD